MIDIEKLQGQRVQLRREKRRLEAAVEKADSGQRRKLQVQLAVTEEKLMDCQDALWRAGRTEITEKQLPTQQSFSSLSQLAESYRAEMEVLGRRIRLVETSALEPGETQARRKDRLRILNAMYRDVRAVAILCERYYDRSYARNERYDI